MKTKQQNIILLTQGGAGDVLAATPAIRSIRKAYPDDKIIVISTYKQLLENNPNIDVLESLSAPKDFYSEYVMNQPVRFFKKHFIYDHIYDVQGKNCSTLPEFICNCYDTEYDGKPPDYFVTDYEKKWAKSFITQTKKKKVLLHIMSAVPSDGGYQKMLCGGCGGKGLGPDGNRCSMCGGSGKVVLREKSNNMKDLNPETLIPIIKNHNEKFDFLQIGLDGEPVLPGAVDCLGMPMRDTIALIPECDSFIFIESLFAHAAGAFGKSGVVVFQNTSPDFFGYSTNWNVHDSGGCPDWPCNRPVGALLDFLPGYRNPKEPKQLILWECGEKQVCNKLSPKKLEKIFLESVGDKAKQGCASLEEAREIKPIKQEDLQKALEMVEEQQKQKPRPQLVKAEQKIQKKTKKKKNKQE